MPIAKMTNAKFTAPSFPWVQAKLNGKPQSRVQKSERAVAKQAPTPTLKSRAEVPGRDVDIQQADFRQNDFRQAGAHYIGARLKDSHAGAIPVAFTEIIFVVVDGCENSVSNQPVYQIQMWRLTVLHPAVDSNSRIYPKQT
jgi:hypothetical protein